MIVGKLSQQKEAIKQRIMKLNGVRENIHAAKEKVHEETRTAFSGMLERLESAAEPKVARLISELSTLEQSVKEIEVVLQYAESSSTLHPAEFLSRIKVFRDNINYILMKGFEKDIQETPFDLPRELYDLRITMESMDNQDILLALKNQIIIDLAMKNAGEAVAITEDCAAKEQDEVKSWIDFADKQSAQLAQFALVCHFCSQPFGEEVVNERCHINRSSNAFTLRLAKGFSEKTPDEADIGTGFHCFAKPDLESLKDARILQLLSTQNPGPGQETNPYRTVLIHEIEKNLNALRRCIEKTPAADLESELKLYDKFGVGVVNRVTLLYVVNCLFNLPETYIDPIISALDPFKRDLISIQELMHMIRDPMAIEALPFFTYAAQPVQQGFDAYCKKFEGFRLAEQEKIRQEEKRKEQIELAREKQFQLLLQEKAKLEAKDGKPADKSGGTGGQPLASKPQSRFPSAAHTPMARSPISRLNRA